MRHWQARVAVGLMQAEQKPGKERARARERFVSWKDSFFRNVRTVSLVIKADKYPSTE